MQRSIGSLLARRWGPLGACAFAATLFLPRNADAQSLGAANVPLPNVLLLLDTSGSFENMIDGNTPETPGENGTCAPGAAGVAAQPSVPNRWGTAVQALTGSIQPYYSCASMNRSSTGFFNQYAISTSGGAAGLKAPYDTGYYLPFHRPISVDSTSGTPVNCMYTPYALPGAAAGGGVGNGPSGTPSATSSTDCSGTTCTALDFPADAIGTYAYLTTGALPGQTVNQAANQCTFAQSSNGAIDASASLMRFGLMTFDNDPDPGIGVTYGTLPSLFPASTGSTTPSAFGGQWSYFHGWNSAAPTPCPGAYVPCVETGFPAGCTISPAPFFEVGARNPAAPPWEGRLMTFPGQGADTTATIESNQNVQLAIESMRPYGATPIAGMFDDAEEYLWNDPTGPQVTDQFVSGGCRAEYIILLTDGQPNQDLEPQCAASGSPPGKCPYQTAYQTALSLYNGTDPVTGRSGQKVITYVIGFAVSQNISPAIANCAALAKSTGGYATYCPSAQPTDPQYPCCQLQQIAAAGQGGTGQAYFADTPGDLNAALGAILGNIASQITSQTLPVYSPSVSYSSGSSGAGTSAEFLTTFSGASVPWSGNILRQELVCTGTPLLAQPLAITANIGDNFLEDMRAGTPSSRQFMAFKMPLTADTSGVDPGLTIRPYLSLTPETTDGLASFGSTGSEIGMSQSSINNTNFPPSTLNVTMSSCEDPTTHVFLTAADCANVALAFAMAQPTVSTPSSSTFSNTFASTTSRCPASGTCWPLGAILHSTPNLTVPPNAILRDDSYQLFATSLSPGILNPPRNPTLFVATTDGLLHAFDTTVTTEVNNELWSFFPPGVMPNLLSNYPSANAILLDGAPVVKDVVWQRTLGQPSTTWQSAWHTMLVAGFGAGGRGYYALDVTDPRNTGSNYKAVNNFTSFPPVLTGPHFQWQIASVNPPGGPYNNNEIFGTTSATPAITTVYADPVTAGASPSEIGVAILPGGSSGPPVSAVPCSRDLSANPGTYSPTTSYNTSDPNFVPRTQVRRWAKNCNGPGSGVPGRSITVVRMDTGDILAVFGRPSTSSPDLPTNLLNANRLIKAPFDSPMTGTPVVYPPDVGAIAQQVFVGDADGTMWRLDLTNANPALWTASLFFDSYNQEVDLNQYNASDTNHAADDSEAIVVTPITTIDSQGNLTLQYATGDQSSYTASYTIPGSPNKPLEEINFVYSMRVGTSTAGAVQSQVNWYLPLRYGERVTGPMAVFDNTFYFATFAPPNPSLGGILCNSGTPKLWGLDFEVPLSTCGVAPNDWEGIPTGCGGNPRDFLPNGFLADPPPATGSGIMSTANIVIPGVAIAVSPSCTNTSVPAADQYTGGMHTTATGSTSGTYSLVAQIGMAGGGNKGAPNTVPHALLAPNSTTLVDSWATLAE